MAEGALDPDRLERVAGENAGYAYDGIQLEQRDGDRRIVEVDAAFLNLLEQIAGKRVDIDLQADGERRPRAHAWSHASERGALDGLMQSQRIAPEGLIAE